MNLLYSFTSLLLLLFCHNASASPDYSERLLLQPLAPASVLASFNFRSNASQDSYEKQHFRYFPRSLAQILQHANAKELHLRFSTGRWDAESWGTRPWGGAKEGGTGVEIWAWLEAGSDEEAFQRWITLNHALAGLFCASMNFIDSTRTSRPVMTFEPLGEHRNTLPRNLHLLHGTLPREVVCTENLTPFLKLLPCKGKAGIASLLDGHKLFDATWQTMSVDVRPVCPLDEEDCIMEMEQTIDMVLDIERSKRPRDNPIPRPLKSEELVCDQSRQYPTENSCYPLDLSQPQDWSLLTIFGRPVKGTCLRTQNDETAPAPVCIKAPRSLDVFATEGVGESEDQLQGARCLEIPDSDDFVLVVPKQDPSRFPPVDTPPLYAERSITGHGQERGGVQTLLTNPSATHPVEFIYLEALPWFMKPYLHTLDTRIAGNASLSSSSSSSSASPDPVIKDIYYRPGLDRHRGSQLELRITVPAASTAVLTYDFEKAILRYTEYPPDANRGRDVAPAVIRLVKAGGGDLRGDPGWGGSSGSGPMYLRTTSLMLPLPTPDFSMPYNVIILTSTVIALAFGNVYNVMVRRFVGADESDGLTLKARLGRALGRALRFRRPVQADEKKTQ